MRAAVGVCALAGLLAAAGAAHDEALVVSRAMTGGTFTYVVEHGDSVAGLSARFGTDRAVIARENGLAVNAPLPAGRPLVLDNRHIVPVGHDATIVLNVPQRMLFYIDDEAAPIGYPVAVGQRDWQTPRGPFEVVAREEQPTWDVPRSIQEEMRRTGRPVLTQVPPGPDNPLGKFWLGLTLPGIGIHSTSTPTSIYRAVTHGCIRLHPDAAQELFLRVTIGMRGVIVYEPVLIAAVDGTVFLEAHRDVYDLSSADPMPTLRRAVDEGGLGTSINWNAARDALNRRDGIARPIGSSARTSEQVSKGLGQNASVASSPHGSWRKSDLRAQHPECTHASRF